MLHHEKNMFIQQAAHGAEIPKSSVSGTSQFHRDTTYSTQTFQVKWKENAIYILCYLG